jgi:hypothetical protein
VGGAVCECLSGWGGWWVFEWVGRLPCQHAHAGVVGCVTRAAISSQGVFSLALISFMAPNVLRLVRHHAHAGVVGCLGFRD